MKEQKYLFEVLAKKIPDQIGLVNEVCDLLGVSANSAYRRLRGEKELSFSELLLLCRKFNVSMDEICHLKSSQNIIFKYAPVDFSQQESYITYIKRLSESLSFYKSANDTEINITAQDIPFFYFLGYPELMFFKLYVWNDTVNRTQISFHEFCDTLDKKTIIPVYNQMAHAWKQIPSKEIWTNQTCETIVRLLEYYYEIGAFKTKDDVLFLLHQLSELIRDIQKCAHEGYKGDNRKTPFHLYLCNVDFENNFMLIRRERKMSCTIRLFTVNSIITEHEDLCVETAKWIDDLISKSALISGTAVRERMWFFNSSNSKIECLINKIEKHK